MPGGSLSIFSDGVYDSIVKHLGPHGPDGLLAFVIFAGVLSAILLGLEPYLTCGFGLAIFVIYCVRKGYAERHQERLAEQRVSETQLSNQRYREGQRSKLEQVRLKRLTTTAPQKGKSR